MGNVYELKTVPCPGCGGVIRWAKVDYIVEDGYRDWRLDIWCERCGAVTDPAVVEAVRGVYDQQVGRAIADMQARALRDKIGGALYEDLEVRLRPMGYAVTGPAGGYKPKANS